LPRRPNPHLKVGACGLYPEVTDARRNTEMCAEQLVIEEGITSEEARERCVVEFDEVDRGERWP